MRLIKVLREKFFSSRNVGFTGSINVSFLLLLLLVVLVVMMVVQGLLPLLLRYSPDNSKAVWRWKSC